MNRLLECYKLVFDNFCYLAEVANQIDQAAIQKFNYLSKDIMGKCCEDVVYH